MLISDASIRNDIVAVLVATFKIKQYQFLILVSLSKLFPCFISLFHWYYYRFHRNRLKLVLTELNPVPVKQVQKNQTVQ